MQNKKIVIVFAYNYPLYYAPFVHSNARKEHRIRGALFLRWDGVDEDHSRIALAVFPILLEAWGNSQDERSEVVVTNPPSCTLSQ